MSSILAKSLTYDFIKRLDQHSERRHLSELGKYMSKYKRPYGPR